MCVGGVPECVYILHASTFKGQERTSDALELESSVVVSCPTWVLGIDPGSSALKVCALKECGTSTAPPPPTMFDERIGYSFCYDKHLTGLRRGVAILSHSLRAQFVMSEKARQ